MNLSCETNSRYHADEKCFLRSLARNNLVTDTTMTRLVVLIAAIEVIDRRYCDSMARKNVSRKCFVEKICTGNDEWTNSDDDDR